MKITMNNDVRVNNVMNAPIERPNMERANIVVGGVQKSGEVAHLPHLHMHNFPYLQRYGA